MTGGLPELFGKAFAIGFLFPAAAIAISAFGVLAAFGLEQQALAFGSEDKLVGTAIALVLIWFLAIALMALNRSAIRCLEGYGRFNPVKLIGFLEKRRFTRLRERLRETESLLADAKSAGRPLDSDALAMRSRLQLQMASDFPDDMRWLLPTRFGNTVRAFEVYPRVVYDLEGIQGWSRLAAVVPEEFARAIAETKSRMDFWINILFGGLAILAMYVTLALLDCSLPQWRIPLAAIAICCISSISARAVAAEWGALVMSAFDLYRGDLCAKLGFEMPRSIEAERRMWRTFSQVAIYRSRSKAERFTGFRQLSSKDAESD